MSTVKLQTSLISISRITCDVPVEEFSPAKLERGVKAYLTVKGLINPMIVRRDPENMMERYLLVEGAFQYHVARMAYEVDKANGEMTQAIIIDRELGKDSRNDEEALLEQIKLFR